MSYTKSFVVDQPPAFAAVGDVRGWWSEEIEVVPDRTEVRFTHHGLVPEKAVTA